MDTVATRALPRIGRVRENLRIAGFIDVETTGLHPGFDEVVEFAIVLFAFDAKTGQIAGVVDEYVGLRDPGRPIPPQATRVHGIRDTDVHGKRLDERRIGALVERAEFLVAHNASFDRAFVEKLVPQTKEKHWYCSMNGVPWKRLGFVSKGLQRLLADHGIRVNRAHRGLDDVKGALALLARADASGSCYFKYIADWHRATVSGVAMRSGTAAERAHVLSDATLAAASDCSSDAGIPSDATSADRFAGVDEAKA